MNSFDDSDSFVLWENDSDDKLDYPSKNKTPRLNDYETCEEGTKNSESKNDDPKQPDPTYKKSFAEKYLLKLGHKKGCGLGKHQDGIVEPVEASRQKGRRGLGFKAVGLETAVSKYDPSLEVVTVDEEVYWLENEYSDTLNKDLFDSWTLKVGSPKDCISDDTPFCEADTVKNILSSKTVLDAITPRELKNARRRANPFESIHKAIFLNRAAMKMANLDAILNRMFTEPRNINGEKLLGSHDLLYFADVCAGPGGFSEYILFRKKWRAKGFGFTLRNHNDFLLDEFCAGPSETFEPHYGSKGDGDVFIPENILSFKNHVLKYTDGKGVHFMMADGGVQIEEKFNDQELICKKLYLCQCLVALLIVRIDGHFVVKLFDLFTPFSVGLLYLMYRSFRRISIIKPNTSRPANSERYLVCQYKREDCKDIADHLFSINEKVPLYGEKLKPDILEVVPAQLLMEDSRFYDYITSSNNRIGRHQILSLTKLAAFSEDVDLKEERQQELRRECLKKWNIPDEARAEPKKCDARTKSMELLGTSSLRGYETDANLNTISSFESFKKDIISVWDWHCVVLSGESSKNTCAFYLGLGRNNVNKYTSRGWTKWDDGLNVYGLCLPANTLVYGELVPELFGEGKSQSKRFAFHIIDGLFLGGEDIRHLSIQERWKMCELFAKSLYKEMFPVRMKKHYEFSSIDTLWKDLLWKSIKSSSSRSLCLPLEEDFFYKAGGIIFFKDTKGFWHRWFSFSKRSMYLDNPQTRSQIFELMVNGDPLRSEIYAEFDHTFRHRLIWWWDCGVVIHDNQIIDPDPNKMQAKDLSSFVARRISKCSPTSR